MGPDDPDGGERLLVPRLFRLETPVLLEREPLPVGPMPPMGAGLLLELGTVDTGIEGHRLPGSGASHDPCVNRHGNGDFVCRERHRVVLHTTRVAKDHVTILRAPSQTRSPLWDQARRLTPPAASGVGGPRDEGD